MNLRYFSYVILIVEGLIVNENVEKVVDQIIDLLHERIDKLKSKISDVCKSEVESNGEI